MITQSNLDQMKNMDIHAINKDTLADMSGFEFDNSLSHKERAARVCKAAKNPYLFRLDDTAVKLEFTENGPPMQDILSGFLIRQKSGL